MNHKNRTVGFVSELDSRVELRLNPVVVVPELKAHRWEDYQQITILVCSLHKSIVLLQEYLTSHMD